MCLWFKHTPHQKHGMSQSMTNASKSQWAFDYPPVNLLFGAATFEFVTSASVSAGFAVYSHWTRCSGRDEDRQMKAWIWICSSQLYGFWRSGLHRTNKMYSFSNYVVVLVFFIVLLWVIVCWRKRFLWPMAKVNISWKVKVKRFKCYYFMV